MKWQSEIAYLPKIYIFTSMFVWLFWKSKDLFTEQRCTCVEFGQGMLKHSWVMRDLISGQHKTNIQTNRQTNLLAKIQNLASKNSESLAIWIHRCIPSPYGTTWCFINNSSHYNDVIVLIAMASQMTSITDVYSTVHLGADQRKHQSSASLAFVLGIQRWPVNSLHKGPVTRKMFPFDDVIMGENASVFTRQYVNIIMITHGASHAVQVSLSSRNQRRGQSPEL